MAAMARYQCPACGQTYAADRPLWRCQCGSHLNLAPGGGLRRGDIAANEASLWRYAAALALEAERWRIERRLGEVARDAGGAADVREFARLSERLETADGELAGLRSLLRRLLARRRVLRRNRS